jgi:hypothetical protein
MPLYETDYHAWALDVAGKIRRGEFESVDWANVAEEIESLGRSERAKLESLLEIILLHLLGWEHQPTHRSRSWHLSLKEHRRRLSRHLSMNPGLKPLLADALAAAWETSTLRGAGDRPRSPNLPRQLPILAVQNRKRLVSD